MYEIPIYLATAVLVAGIPGLYVYSSVRRVKRAKQRLAEAQKKGLTEPVTLHPVIDPLRCINSGACVTACPEGRILGVINGRAELVSPSKCIGHGACEAACPVEAIALVFGTERRGVELPFVRETFETNVSGVYIAGELGGMGLIRNAVAQGKEAIGSIRESLGHREPHIHDVIIVGAGPAGLAASLQAMKEGLDFLTLEQDEIGGAIMSYPRQKLVMTHPMEIPLYGKVRFREIIKEDLLEIWTEIIEKTGLEVRTGERVENIQHLDDCYRIVTPKGEHLAQRVLLAIGRRGTPRKLGVPGESSSKVAYRLIEPVQYVKKRVLVIGGGDSAVEAALSLSEQKGCEVSLSYRNKAFGRIRERNEERITQAMRDGAVRVYLESQVQEIRREEVLLTCENRSSVIANDFVFVFIGGVLPTEFLKQVGISIQKKYGER